MFWHELFQYLANKLNEHIRKNDFYGEFQKVSRELAETGALVTGAQHAAAAPGGHAGCCIDAAAAPGDGAASSPWPPRRAPPRRRDAVRG